jgi:formyltetrahydrofolate deformylase
MDLVIANKAKLQPAMEAVPDGQLTSREFVLSLSCKDSKGVVFAVSGLLYQVGCNILDSQQFSDVEDVSGSGLFFMRVHFEAPPALADSITLSKMFSHVTERFDMYARFEPLDRRPRVLILVSKFSHCLNDLIFRQQTGQLPMEIAAVVSNHNDLRGMAERFNLPFHHLPLKTGASLEC